MQELFGAPPNLLQNIVCNRRQHENKQPVLSFHHLPSLQLESVEYRAKTNGVKHRSRRVAPLEAQCFRYTASTRLRL